MSEVDDTFEDETVDQSAKNPVRSHLRKLEEEVKALRQAAAEAEAAKKELAFVKAGVPMDHPASKYFIKGYDGDFTPEAIRAALEEANLIQSQQKQPEVQAEQNAWNRLQKAQRAGQTSEPPVDWAARINNARSQDEVMTLLAQARQEAENL
jgi:hypothetical protein